jgi:hypothetical protein
MQCNVALALIPTAQQRAWMVRMYAFSSGIAGLLVIGIGLMRSITHFTYKVSLLHCSLGTFWLTVGRVN